MFTISMIPKFDFCKVPMFSLYDTGISITTIIWIRCFYLDKSIVMTFSTIGGREAGPVPLELIQELKDLKNALKALIPVETSRSHCTHKSVLILFMNSSSN